MRTVNPAASDAYEAIFSALAHPARRRILISLNFAGGALTAGEIAGLFAQAWPTTTRHLQQLEAAGIVRSERQGRVRLYRLQTRALALARDWLDWFERDPVTAARKGREDDDQRSDASAVPPQHRGGRA